MKRFLLTFLIAVFFPLASFAQDLRVDNVDIHGFISQGYTVTTDNNYLTDTEDGSFEFNELGINFATEASDDLRIGIQILSRDFGRLSNNDVVVDWALADYRVNDQLGLKAGIIKRPFGLYNEVRDIDALRTSILLPQGVYNETLRDSTVRLQGVGLYGVIEADTAGAFKYEILAGTQNIDEDGGEAQLIEEGAVYDIYEINNASIYQFSLEWLTPLPGLRVKGDLSRQEFDTHATGDARAGDFRGADFLAELDPIKSYVAGIEYIYQDITLAAEYFQREVDADLSIEGTPVPARSPTSEGWYALVSYQIDETYEVGTYFSSFTFDTDNRSDTETKDIALSFKANIDDAWTFKVEGHYFDGTSLLYAADNPDGVDDNWFMFLSKLAYTF